jgi:(2Fe-2S) ferredoxin
MTINTKTRLSILASALALVVAAPAAIAQGSGTWYGNVHTDPITSEGLVTRHSRELMETKSAAPAAVAQNSGTWYGNMHTDPVTAEGLTTRHSKALMEKKIVTAGNEIGRVDELRSPRKAFPY